MASARNNIEGEVRPSVVLLTMICWALSPLFVYGQAVDPLWLDRQLIVEDCQSCKKAVAEFEKRCPTKASADRKCRRKLLQLKQNCAMNCIKTRG